MLPGQQAIMMVPGRAQQGKKLAWPPLPASGRARLPLTDTAEPNARAEKAPDPFSPAGLQR